MYGTSERGLYRFENLPPIEGYVLVRSDELEFTSSKVQVKLIPQETVRCRVKYEDKDSRANSAVPASIEAIESNESSIVRVAADEEDAFWGQPSDGVQCRLKPLKSVWRTDDVPTLSLDIRNQGNETIDFCRIAEAHCEIDISGRWYGLAEPLILDAPVWELKPGMELNDAIEVRLTESWALPREGTDPPHAPGIAEKWGERLKLAPRKHSLRVRFRPHEWLQSYVKNETNKFVLSNYVGAEFVAADEEDALWGEPVEGLRIKLSARTPLQLDPTPTFRMDIRNHSENE